MDLQTYETITLPESLVDDVKSFMKEGGEVEVLFIEGNAVSVTLPPGGGTARYRIVGRRQGATPPTTPPRPPPSRLA